ncbi:MAG: hypothetical protein IKZ87_00235 [Actinomycetaceae bacterium]|nr:hypothetical protein [Actinomycetaceae bacterium]
MPCAAIWNVGDLADMEENQTTQQERNILTRFSDECYAGVQMVFADWVGESVIKKFGGTYVPGTTNLQGVYDMLSENIDRYIERLKAEGRAEWEAKGRAEGEAKGRAEGEAKGRTEGRAEGIRDAARMMFKNGGMSSEAIARMLELDESEVRCLAV